MMSYKALLFLVIALLVGEFFLDALADLLNLRHLKPTLPREFEGFYDSQAYARSQNYLRDNSNLGQLQGLIVISATIAFIVCGGFNWADEIARGLGWNPLLTGLVFVGILTVLRFLLRLPFSVFHTFVIEEKYGFNRTTPKTFLLDLLKGLLVGGALGGGLFVALIYFFEKLGSTAWLYAWILFTGFTLLISYLAPAVLLPLFNKFDPLPEGALKSAILDYIRKENFELSGIFTMDGSKRSTKTNAFFTGFGKLRRLVLFDTLITRHTTEELVAILAHEIGHFKKRHIQKSIALSIATSGVMFYVLSLLINNETLFKAFKMDAVSTYASIVFVSFLFTPFLRFISIFSQMLSRKFEYEADAYAVKTYGNQETLVLALKKLSVDNLSNLTPHPLKILLDYTHPPILKRIEAIQNQRY